MRITFSSKKNRESLNRLIKAVIIEHQRPNRSTRLGKPTRYRVRISVEYIYQSLGPIYFRRAYRMTFETFQRLYEILEPYLARVIGEDPESKRYVPNGRITKSVRLACAIRYFAGGSPYDIMCKYGLGHSDFFRSVWFVVDAVNMVQEFHISYPSSHDEQLQIAHGFRQKSAADFTQCAGAIDGILIWIPQPTTDDSDVTGVGVTKYLCARKGKFGLNCQAVCDARNRFLDISITYPGSTSDCLAFEGSALYSRLEDGLLHPNLCLFGDNAYINTHYMATPFSGGVGGSKDAYNFYHSQLRINIECAFGILTERWGILRSAMPRGITIKKTTALVICLAKLHNFCINHHEGMLPGTSNDQLHIESNESGHVALVQRELTGDQHVPAQLIGAGHHFQDVVRRDRRQQQDTNLPRYQLLAHVEEAGLSRPALSVLRGQNR